MRRSTRLAVATGVVAAAVVGSAGPAAADPPGPTDYETEILGLEPAVPGVTPSIIGGDSFVRLEVAPGTEVLVIGYQGEPYIRFLPDGTVEENVVSPSRFLSLDRYADVDLPPEADADADPVWQRVDDDGSWSWHDHRSHWMGEQRPLGAEPGDVVLEAVIPLEVDGEEVALAVRSSLLGDPSPAPAVVGALAGLALVVAGARRFGGSRGGAVVVAPLAATALVLGIWQVRSVPAETGPPRLAWLLAAAALLPALAAVLLARRRASPAGRPPSPLVAALVVVAGAELALWGWERRAGLTSAIIPTGAPYVLDRFVTAASMTAGLAVVGVVLASLVLPPATPAMGHTGRRRVGPRHATPDPRPGDPADAGAGDLRR